MLANVRPRAASLVLGLASLLLAAGCGDDAPPESASGPAPDGRFGAPYEVLLGETPASPDEPPHLEGDTLVVLVGFSGGCGEHDFHLEHEVEADTARLWLRHEADDDACEARLTEPLRLTVPSDVRDAPHRFLLHPGGGRPFVVTGRP